MANKYSDHMFQLIKSLTKAEKRYFKLFVARHTSSASSPNNAQVLFDLIEKMDLINNVQYLLNNEWGIKEYLKIKIKNR